jgi:catechol 2,3-dioxygenase-like lactoylglutathione lyase family enzyme
VNILKGHHVGLTVKSLRQSLKFYRDLLGLEVAFSWNPKAPYIKTVTGYSNAEFYIAILRVPNSEIFVEILEYRGVDQSKIDHRTGNPGIAHLAFQVDDVDEWFQFLNKNGIASVSQPVIPSTGPNRGGKIVYVIDPDGYRVELIQTSNEFSSYTPSKTEEISWLPRN